MSDYTQNLRVRLGVEGIAAAQAGIGSFTAALGGLRNVIGLIASGAAFSKFHSFITEMDDMSKTAQKIGTTVEELSGLQLAAELSGVALESFSGAMAKFSKSIVEASINPNSEQARFMAAIGISAKDAEGNIKPLRPLLLEIADAFSAMTDDSIKTATAMSLFGKSGADLIPFFNSGRKGIEDLTSRSKELGLVMTTGAAHAAEEFNDNLALLGATFRGMSLTVVREVLPTLVRMSEALRDGLFEARQLASTSPVLISYFKSLAVVVAAASAALVVFKLAIIAVNAASAGGLATLGKYSAILAGIAGAASVFTLGKEMFGAFTADAQELDSVGKLIVQNQALADAIKARAQAQLDSKEITQAVFDDITKYLSLIPTEANEAHEALMVLVRTLREAFDANAQSAPVIVSKNVIPENFAHDLAVIRAAQEGIALSDRTRATKAREILPLLAQEYEVLRNIAQAATVRRDALQEKFSRAPVGTKEESAEANRLLAEYQKSQAEVVNTDREIVALRTRQREIAEATTFSGAFSAGFRDLVDSFGTLQEQASAGFFGAIKTGIDGITSGLTNAIVVTGNFEQALSGIRTAILTEIVGAFIRMAAQWVLSHVIMRGVSLAWSALSSALRAKDATETVATETSKMAVTGPSAILTSISSYGLAAVVGLAAVLGAVSAFGGFREQGGDVQPGRAYVVGEKRPELFVPRSAGTIVPRVPGNSGGTSARARSGQSAEPVQVSVSIHNDLDAAVDSYMQSPAGEKRLMKMVRGKAVELGIRT
jgi:hypothetical protein